MNKIDWEILANHLTGQATAEEEEKLAEWLGKSAENQEFLERMSKIWRAESKAFQRLDTEGALRLVMSRIQRSSTVHRGVTDRVPTSPHQNPIQQFLTQPMFFRAAAVLVIAIGAFAVFSILRPNREIETSTITFAGVQTLQLPDGTRITFDSGSTFTYPKSFDGAEAREVSLDGEAFFEVTRNEKLPFTVHANGGTIKVLGTSFAVRSWKSDENIVVAVKEGRVSFQPDLNEDTSRIVYLTENMMSKLSRRTAVPTPAENTDFSKSLSWMRREIYFQNTPVPDVLRQLERWYHVSIQAADSAMLHENVTVFIGNKPLAENLDLLAVILDMRVIQRGDSARFVRR
jgi:ferric-dicitrate binding protein FerR (iron transport regulator)